MNIFYWPFKFNHFKVKDKVSENQGTTSIEFGLIAPIFLLLLIGIFEIGCIVLVQQSLETALLEVSRFGRTGDVVAGQTPEETADSIATKYSFGLVDPAKLVLTVTPYASFSAVPPLSTAPNDGTQNFGTSNQVVLYTLSYKWNLFTALVGNAIGVNFVNLTASTIVENEPY